jgi:hypothetical protein
MSKQNVRRGNDYPDIMKERADSLLWVGSLFHYAVVMNFFLMRMAVMQAMKKLENYFTGLTIVEIKFSMAITVILF